MILRPPLTPPTEGNKAKVLEIPLSSPPLAPLIFDWRSWEVELSKSYFHLINKKDVYKE